MSRTGAGFAVLLSLSVVALLTQIGALGWLSLEETASPGRLTSRRLRIDARGQAPDISCLIYLPESYDSQQDKSWPFVLFLHGSSQRGDDIERVRECGVPRLIEDGTDFPFIMAAPQCPEEQSWNTETLLRLLDHLKSEFNVDEDRIYVTGFELGAYATWDLATTAPDTLAAIVPFGGHPSDLKFIENTDWLKKLHVWSFYNENDKSTEFDRTKAVLSNLWRNGGYGRQTKLTDSNEPSADAWTRAYTAADVFSWMLAQNRRSMNTTRWKDAPPSPGEEAAGVFQNRNDAKARDVLNYRLYLPPDYGQSEIVKTWPLIVFLEGKRSSEHPSGKDADWLAEVAVNKRLPFIVASVEPSKKKPRGPQDVLTLVEHLNSQFSISTEKVSLVGDKEGAADAWKAAVAEPDRFAALALIEFTPPAHYKPQANRLSHLTKWFLASDSQLQETVDYCRLASQLLAAPTLPEPRLILASSETEITNAHADLIAWLQEQPGRGMRGRHDRWPGNDRPGGVFASPEVAALFEEQTHRFSGGRYQNEAFRYRLFKPRPLQENNQYPLVIWLHGHGPPELHLEEAELQYIDMVLQDAVHPEKYPFYLLAMQCPSDRSWFEDDKVAASKSDKGDEPTTILMEIVEELSSRYPIDRNRISAIGISSGGTACWELAMRHPGIFSAIVPLGSGDVNVSRIVHLEDTSIWAFHSTMDKDISPEGVRRAVQAARNQNINVRFTEIPRSSHHCWVEAFRDFDILQWLLVQE